MPVNVRDYKAAGYEPEALANFLAFLGWNPGTEQEFFTLSELEQAFSLDRVGSAPAKFDLDKLKWFNAQHLHMKTATEVYQRAQPYLDAANLDPDPEYALAVTALVQSRLEQAGDLAENFVTFLRLRTLMTQGACANAGSTIPPELVTAYASALSELTNWDEPALENTLRTLAAEHGVGAGRLIHPVRLAVSGTTMGPGLFAMLQVLGQDTVVERLQQAAATLS